MLVDRDEAPSCSRATLITHGYRKESDIWACLTSIFKWHNEAVNIWSHFLGALVFLFLGITNTNSVITTFCGVLTAGFTASGVFHVFCCNTKYYTLTLKIDMIGMLGIIGACVGTATHAVTAYVPWLVRLHLTVFCMLMAWTLTVLLGLSSYGETENIARGVTPAVAVAAVVSYWLVAMAHAVSVVQDDKVAFQHMAIFFAFGAEYAVWMLAFGAWKAREPERAFPRLFDYMVRLFAFSPAQGLKVTKDHAVAVVTHCVCVCWILLAWQGNSHNIFHILCVLAAVWHYKTLVWTVCP